MSGTLMAWLIVPPAVLTVVGIGLAVAILTHPNLWVWWLMTKFG